MNQPWYLVGFGALLSVFGAFLVYLGIDYDTGAVMFAGWAVGTLGSLALFVGLIALAVEIGTRAADR